MSITIDGSANTIVGSGVYTLTSPTLVNPVLGTPSSGTVTNLTGTASININGTVGATTPSTGAFTTLSATKATAGDVVTWGAGSSKTGYLYADATYLGIMDIGGVGTGNGFLIGTSIYCQIGGATKVAISSTEFAVTGTISATTTIKTGGYTVATLPAGVTGDRAYVTDATAPTYLGALTGGGVVVCPVFKNATTWVSA